jgi:membrane fusion protein (multidrug efflux system)
MVAAPVSGVVGDRQAQLGEYVQPGTRLMTIVPMDTVYVVANFKETQTARDANGPARRNSHRCAAGKGFRR